MINLDLLAYVVAIGSIIKMLLDLAKDDVFLQGVLMVTLFGIVITLLIAPTNFYNEIKFTTQINNQKMDITILINKKVSYYVKENIIDNLNKPISNITYNNAASLPKLEEQIKNKINQNKILGKFNNSKSVFKIKDIKITNHKQFRPYDIIKKIKLVPTLEKNEIDKSQNKTIKFKKRNNKNENINNKSKIEQTFPAPSVSGFFKDVVETFQ